MPPQILGQGATAERALRIVKKTWAMHPSS